MVHIVEFAPSRRIDFRMVTFIYEKKKQQLYIIIVHMFFFVFNVNNNNYIHKCVLNAAAADARESCVSQPAVTHAPAAVDPHSSCTQ